MHVCLLAARSGERWAVAAVVNELRPRLTTMAAYYARASGEDRDDLLQEAWHGLLEALPGVDVTIGSPAQYLIRRARWRLLDYLRRRRGPAHQPLVEGLACEDAALSHAGAKIDLDEFAQSLPATQRAVMRYLLAVCTWRETGEAIGCTSANIAYHVRRIRGQYARRNGQTR